MFLNRQFSSETPERSFEIGESIGRELRKRDIILLYGGLGAGKTLITKGILSSLGYDIDEVTSPSFSLVNLYKTEAFDVYHLDLWRIEGNQDAASAVGLDEILDSERVVVIIEWAERLKDLQASSRVIRVDIAGDGDDPRQIAISSS